jgi:hypothetical protein
MGGRAAVRRAWMRTPSLGRACLLPHAAQHPADHGQHQLQIAAGEKDNCQRTTASGVFSTTPKRLQTVDLLDPVCVCLYRRLSVLPEAQAVAAPAPGSESGTYSIQPAALSSSRAAHTLSCVSPLSTCVSGSTSGRVAALCERHRGPSCCEAELPVEHQAMTDQHVLLVGRVRTLRSFSVTRI